MRLPRLALLALTEIRLSVVKAAVVVELLSPLQPLALLVAMADEMAAAQVGVALV